MKGHCALLLLSCLLLASCLKEHDIVREEKSRPPHDAALVEVLESICRALEDENSFGVFELVAESYAPSRLALKSSIDQDLERYTGITIHLTPEHVEIMENEDRGVVVAAWRLSRSAREDGEVQWRSGLSEFRFVRSAGKWLLEQQNGDPLF